MHQERMAVLSDVLKHSSYDTEPMLKECGISTAQGFTQVAGRVLQPPKLKAGNGEDIFTRNGRWNFNNKRLIKACTVDRWAVINFSARCKCNNLVRDIIKCGAMNGIKVEKHFDVFEENVHVRCSPAPRRVDDMFGQVKTKLPGAPRFQLWKAFPGSDTPEPSEAGSSTKENFFGDHHDARSVHDGGSRETSFMRVDPTPSASFISGSSIT